MESPVLRTQSNTIPIPMIEALAKHVPQVKFRHLIYFYIKKKSQPKFAQISRNWHIAKSNMVFLRPFGTLGFIRRLV